MQSGNQANRSFVESPTAAVMAVAAVPVTGRDDQVLATYRQRAETFEGQVRNSSDEKVVYEGVLQLVALYRRAGEFRKAIEFSNEFLTRYAEEPTLEKIEAKGSITSTSYLNHLATIVDVYNQLSALYLLSFEPVLAARTKEKLAGLVRINVTQRRQSLLEAIEIYRQLGLTSQIVTNKSALLLLKPREAERAQAEFALVRVTSDEAKRDVDTPAAKSKIERAKSDLRNFFNTYKNTPEAAQLVVHCAWLLSRIPFADTTSSERDSWARQTIAAFAVLRKLDPAHAVGSAEGEMAAAASLSLMEREIEKNFAMADIRRSLRGYKDDVLRQYMKTLDRAAYLSREFEQLFDSRYFGSVEVTLQARVIHAQLFGTLRNALSELSGNTVRLFTDSEERKLVQFEDSGIDKLMEFAHQQRDTRARVFYEDRRAFTVTTDQQAIIPCAWAWSIAQQNNLLSALSPNVVQQLVLYFEIYDHNYLEQFTQSVPGFRSLTLPRKAGLPGMPLAGNVDVWPPNSL